ncbi:MAG: hypothetical protein RL651_1211 [Pseudomonadota bacterium]|jgi:hypothetical protein
MKSHNRKTKGSGLVVRETPSHATAESLTSIARNHRGNSAQNQRERILDALRTHGAITTIEMRKYLDVMSPAPRIMELRRMGKRITTHWVKQATDSGKAHRVALYVLEA